MLTICLMCRSQSQMPITVSTRRSRTKTMSTPLLPVVSVRGQPTGRRAVPRSASWPSMRSPAARAPRATSAGARRYRARARRERTPRDTPRRTRSSRRYPCKAQAADNAPRSRARGPGRDRRPGRRCDLRRLELLERPAWARDDTGRGLGGNGRRATRPGVRDHRAVIRAKRRPRITHLEAVLAARVVERGAKPPIRAHPARDDQPLAAGPLDREPALVDQGVDDGRLETGGDIRTHLVRQPPRVALRFDREPHGGLQTAEAHVEPLPLQRPRERESLGIAALGQRGQRGAA